MSIKSILVPFDGDPNMPVRASIAVQLATKFEAHITALHVAPTLVVPPMMAAKVAALAAQINESIRRAAESKARAHFAKLETTATTPVEWRIDSGDGGKIVALHARYADLTILSQYDADGEATNYWPDMVENVLLDCGRPVLVVPHAGHFPTVGTNVLIAWNASREATRAVADALPFLRSASKVTIMVLNPARAGEAHGAIPGADIGLYLARHGIKAEAVSIVAEDIDVGGMLLSRAADLGNDLLVMGAYGRSRLREFVMGGASRNILRHMTIPVLMSH